MQWLHPWAIGMGALAATLPIVVHFLTRPRPIRLPLSTIRFVHEAVAQRRARHRLRDILVLALRCLAAFLLGLTIARLQLGTQPLISAGDTHEAVRVVVLDASQSMAASQRGIEVFERARSIAANYLAYRSGLRVDLLVAGATARALMDRPTFNIASLRDDVGNLRVLPERLNAQLALNRAAEILAQAAVASGGRRELIVISDFQRTNWSTVSFAALPRDTNIQFESVASQESPTNLAILRVEPQGRAELGRTVRLEVEIGNYGPAPHQARVQLEVGDASIQLQGLCPPGGTAVLSHDFEPKTAGWQAGEARLLDVDDALKTDDVRPFVLEVRQAATYALLTREPATLRPSSSYFVERALVPRPNADGSDAAGPRVVRIDPLHLTRDSIAGADLIVLDHPGKISQDAIAWLANFLRRGQSGLYLAAEPVDATNLKLLADAIGSGLQLPVEFEPPPPGQPRRDLFLAEMRKDSSPWKVFAEDLPAVTGSLRFAGGLATRLREGALQDDLLAVYSDRSASLVVTACDAGQLAIWNADFGESTLPRSPAFVPLLSELVEKLLARQRSSGAMQPGEAFAAYLPADAYPAASLQIEAPATDGNGGELVEESSGVLWRMPAAGPPGVYRVVRGGETVFAAASLIPSQESDLRPLDLDVLSQRLVGDRPVFVRSAGDDKRELDDRWSWFALACSLCMVLEVAVLRSFRT